MAKDYSRQEVLEIIQKEAQERGIPRDDFLRFAYIETGGRFDEQASRGPRGAKGLFQFIPSTAEQYGIAGRELDAVANTDAAARLYLDNKRDLTRHHERTGQPYLSGQPEPNGLDMYMAHQQGTAGYHSIQAAISGGSFTRADTRPHILNNVSPRDIAQVTGMSMEQFQQLPDKQLAETFVKYWDTKYRNISIPEVGVQPLGGGQQTTGGQTTGGQTQRPTPAPMADGVLERGEKGTEVRTLQEQLIKAGITKIDGKPFTADGDFGPRTEAAVREYQRTRGLTVDGLAGKETFDALKSNAPAKTQGTEDRAIGGANWPAPGNYTINKADKPGEGHGEFGTSRGGGTRTHKGVDIEGKVGDPIESFRPGTVVAVKPNNGAAGNMVTIDHGNGLTSTYMHLNTINVKPGQQVTENTVIGTMGRTGNTPKQGDTHLHFEIRENGVAVDPMKYLKVPDQSKAPAKPVTGAMADGLLKEGERGTEVRHLQEQLNKLGVRDAQGHPLKTDGIFGKHTEEAVERLQRQRGIAVDGVVGKDTNREITAALKEQADKQTAGALNKPEQTPKLSSANHPDHAMYEQALKGIDKLPPGTFKSDQERQNAAATIVFEAKVSGMTKIDQVMANNNGGLYAIQGDVSTDSHRRIYVDQQQAASQSMERSTQLADQFNQQQKQQPTPPPNEPPKEEVRRNSPVIV